MTAQRIYLDYNATAPAPPAVREAVASALALGGNPSSVHAAGRAARRVVEEARSAVATLVGARAQEIVFTSGGTEANALALRGAPAASLVVSAVEHESLLAAAQASGLPLMTVPVTAEGVVDLAALARALGSAPSPALVSLMLANNETGVLEPIAEAAAIAREAGALVHTDAIQAAGRIPLDVAALGVDMLTLSGHKIGGPTGIGALWVREGLDVTPLITGGGQEMRRRAGTENVPGIAGFGAAAVAAGESLAEMERVARLRDAMEARILAAAPDARVFGGEAPRIANTSALYMPGLGAETQVMAFDLEGVCVSAGSACSSGKVTPSHVIAAMGADETVAAGVIRVSLGAATTRAEIDRFCDIWLKLHARAAARQTAAL